MAYCCPPYHSRQKGSVRREEGDAPRGGPGLDNEETARGGCSQGVDVGETVGIVSSLTRPPAGRAVSGAQYAAGSESLDLLANAALGDQNVAAGRVDGDAPRVAETGDERVRHLLLASQRDNTVVRDRQDLAVARQGDTPGSPHGGLIERFSAGWIKPADSIVIGIAGYKQAVAGCQIHGQAGVTALLPIGFLPDDVVPRLVDASGGRESWYDAVLLKQVDSAVAHARP